jgi:hypothetical protein
MAAELVSVPPTKQGRKRARFSRRDSEGEALNRKILRIFSDAAADSASAARPSQPRPGNIVACDQSTLVLALGRAHDTVRGFALAPGVAGTLVNPFYAIESVDNSALLHTRFTTTALVFSDRPGACSSTRTILRLSGQEIVWIERTQGCRDP